MIVEVTKLKLQLEVPGSAGALTSSADRKLEEGQRVSVMKCTIVAAPCKAHKRLTF